MKRKGEFTGFLLGNSVAQSSRGEAEPLHDGMPAVKTASVQMVCAEKPSPKGPPESCATRSEHRTDPEAAKKACEQMDRIREEIGLYSVKRTSPLNSSARPATANEARARQQRRVEVRHAASPYSAEFPRQAIGATILETSR
jgi:hypothetical protein